MTPQAGMEIVALLVLMGLSSLMYVGSGAPSGPIGFLWIAVAWVAIAAAWCGAGWLYTNRPWEKK